MNYNEDKNKDVNNLNKTELIHETYNEVFDDTKKSEVIQKKDEEKEKLNIKDDEKILIALGYIGFLCLLPIILKKDSQICQYHGKQSIMLVSMWFLFFLLFSYVYYFFVFLNALYFLCILFFIICIYKDKDIRIPIFKDTINKFIF